MESHDCIDTKPSSVSSALSSAANVNRHRMRECDIEPVSPQVNSECGDSHVLSVVNVLQLKKRALELRAPSAVSDNVHRDNRSSLTDQLSSAKSAVPTTNDTRLAATISSSLSNCVNIKSSEMDRIESANSVSSPIYVGSDSDDADSGSTVEFVINKVIEQNIKSAKAKSASSNDKSVTVNKASVAAVTSTSRPFAKFQAHCSTPNDSATHRMRDTSFDSIGMY